MLPEFQITLPLILKPSAFATRAFRVPDPSVELPPVATIAALYPVGACDALVK